MKQSKILVLTIAVALTLVFGIAPAVFGKDKLPDEPKLDEQVNANTAAIAENEAAIAAEAEARIADDNIVQGEVAAERAARIADDNYLQGLIDQNTADIGVLNNIPDQQCPEGEFVTEIDPSGVIQCAPVDGGEPQSYKIIFVSSWKGTTAFGGLASADAICNFLASNAGLPGNYKAWLSDSKTSAADRLTHAEVPYITPTADVVAVNWADLIDGSLLHPINSTEDGGFAPDYFAYTNTTVTGEINDSAPGAACDDWTSTAQNLSVRFGGSGSSDGGWTFSGSNTCDYISSLGNHLYCLQQ